MLLNEEDLKLPKENHPIFYGCFDWHRFAFKYYKQANKNKDKHSNLQLLPIFCNVRMIFFLRSSSVHSHWLLARVLSLFPGSKTQVKYKNSFFIHFVRHALNKREIISPRRHRALCEGHNSFWRAVHTGLRGSWGVLHNSILRYHTSIYRVVFLTVPP